MDVLDFAGEVVLLSASGVLSPGPLFLMNLVYGTKQGYRAGLKIASGHAIMEFPLIIIPTISFFELTNTQVVTSNLNVLGLVGGTSIIIFAIIQIVNTARKEKRKNLFNNSNHRASFIADKPVLLGNYLQYIKSIFHSLVANSGIKIDFRFNFSFWCHYWKYLAFFASYMDGLRLAHTYIISYF